MCTGKTEKGIVSKARIVLTLLLPFSIVGLSLAVNPGSGSGTRMKSAFPRQSLDIVHVHRRKWLRLNGLWGPFQIDTLSICIACRLLASKALWAALWNEVTRG